MAMDNKTVRDAIQVHGTNPQFLIEKILRTRIYESTYWKESCFGLTGMLVMPQNNDNLARAVVLSTFTIILTYLNITFLVQNCC